MKTQDAAYPMPDRFPIEGQHVSLRLLSVSHALPLWRVLREQPPELFHHLFFGPFGTQEEVEAWIRRANQNPGTVPLAIFSKRLETYVGTCSLINLDLQNGAAEIGGIWCSVAAQGTEAVSATTYFLLEYLLQGLGYRRVVWKCDQTNDASRRAAEQMGFTYEGTFRNHLFIRGRSRDTAWYSVIDSEWPEVRARLSERIEKKLRRRSP
ncbi:MAG: GNAT family N-acetyltransferase [Spirochaetaceae bacterium]